VVLSITALIILVIIAVQLPPVQSYLSHKGQVYLEKKLHTKVRIGGVYVGFPKDITLRDIYIEDQRKDTLLFSHKLAVNLDMWALLHHNIKISGIFGNKITAHIYRIPGDTLFNYSFIAQAFAGESKQSEKEQDTTASTWNIALSQIELKDIYFTFKDSLGGTDLYTRLGYLNTTFKDFDLGKQIYEVRKLQIENTAARFEITSKSNNKDTSSSPLPTVGLDRANLKNVSFVFNDKTTGSYYSSAIENSQIEINSIDLKKQIISVDHVDLDKASTLIVFNKPSMADTIKAAADSALTKQPK
jgi:hypothetical protein